MRALKSSRLSVRRSRPASTQHRSGHSGARLPAARSDRGRAEAAAEAPAAPPVRRGSGPANPLAVGIVTAATEALRLLGIGRDRYEAAVKEVPPEPPLAPGDVDGVARRITRDFAPDRQYFVRGVIDDGIYDDQCRFVDPTVSFSGLDLWKRNLALLTPFLAAPSIELLSMRRLGRGAGGAEELETTWTLETWLRLPWSPRIAVEGSTLYTLNADANRVVTHAESWDVTATEALLQLFKPTSGPPPPSSAD